MVRLPEKCLRVACGGTLTQTLANQGTVLTLDHWLDHRDGRWTEVSHAEFPKRWCEVECDRCGTRWGVNHPNHSS